MVSWVETCPLDAVQRTNGRIAMIAFAGAAAAEVATGKSVLQQAARSPGFIIFMVFLLTVAGFMPKLASGVSLSKLLDAAGMSNTNSEVYEMKLAIASAFTSH